MEAAQLLQLPSSLDLDLSEEIVDLSHFDDHLLATSNDWPIMALLATNSNSLYANFHHTESAESLSTATTSSLSFLDLPLPALEPLERANSANQLAQLQPSLHLQPSTSPINFLVEPHGQVEHQEPAHFVFSPSHNHSRDPAPRQFMDNVTSSLLADTTSQLVPSTPLASLQVQQTPTNEEAVSPLSYGSSPSLSSEAYPYLAQPVTLPNLEQQQLLTASITTHKAVVDSSRLKPRFAPYPTLVPGVPMPSPSPASASTSASVSSSSSSASSTYECTTCRKVIRGNMNNLRRHMMIHTGEMPYACTYCNKRFRQRYTCNAHMKVHKADYEFACERCGGRYPTMAALRRHQSEYLNAHLRNKS